MSARRNKKKIFISGHTGLVGSSIYRLFKKKNNFKIIVKTRAQLDLLDQKKVFTFLKKNKFDYVIVAAAKVGGINANNLFKSKFIYQNLQIQNNLIHGSFLSGVKNLIFLGSSCIYPNDLSRPIKETDLLTSNLEPTNEAYSIAKIAGLKMCSYYSENYKLNYKTLMPTNLFGPNDNYDLSTSHFMPALIKKIYLAKKNKKKSIILWGDGSPKREVMYVDDLSNAVLFFLDKKVKNNIINIGSGYEKSIVQFARIIMKFFKINLNIKYDLKKPNGTLRKKLNCNKAKSYGWVPKISFLQGLNLATKDFINNLNNK